MFKWIHFQEFPSSSVAVSLLNSSAHFFRIHLSHSLFLRKGEQNLDQLRNVKWVGGLYSKSVMFFWSDVGGNVWGLQNGCRFGWMWLLLSKPLKINKSSVKVDL